MTEDKIVLTYITSSKVWKVKFWKGDEKIREFNGISKIILMIPEKFSPKRGILRHKLPRPA